ncbi:preprotein translocase subunit YajC [Paraliomyxa miuraensis]|uniref:preprotein translocase subunit YajC n=1 Tax=Paraliomyxa miuraensis TaxID=376150 RepID=UPI0022596490|nr:preprotein translocase subunit YajC [Paraliomyxa miuraensis]MCX4244640.1 preprotein translocase subunit YajC [Paraliomyxa miuraensis]
MITNLSIVPLSPGGAPLMAEGAPAGGLGGMLPILLMFVVIYFIVLRPMSKQEKDRKKRVEALKKGDQVVLQGGILGRITNADDPKIAVVELADRVRIRVLKSKIEDLQENVLKAEEAGAGKKDDKKAAAKDDKAADKSKKTDSKKADDEADSSEAAQKGA